MECPKCWLLNPPTALRCDCGWDFASGTMKDSYLRPAAADAARSGPLAPLSPMWIGFVLAGALFAAELVSPPTPGALVASVLIALAGSIYWLTCVYRFHGVIGAWSNETYTIKPAMALFGHFIPFFNLYWIFKWPIELSTYVNRQSSVHMIHGGWLGGAILLSLGLGRSVSGAWGLAGIFATMAYIRSKLVALTRSDNAGPVTSRLACPNCGDPYDPADYREDADHIYCSTCKAEVPRTAQPQTTSEPDPAAPASSVG